MAKRRVDFSDYNEPTWEEYTGEPPLANRWYPASVKRGKYDGQKDQMVWILEITEGDYKGWGRGFYTPFDGTQKWKLQDLIRAVQGGKTTAVEIDWENEKAVENWLKKAKPIKLKTQFFNEDISINKVAPALSLVPGDTSAAPAPAEPELAEADVPDDEPIEDYTEEELAAMTAEELEKVLMDEFDVSEEDLPDKPRRDPKGEKYMDALIEEVLTLQEGEPADGESPDEGDPEFEDGFDDGQGDEPEPEPEPEPAPAPRRTRAAKAAPAKAAPAKAAAPAPATRRRRG
jgi:hypothetical protein